MKIAIPMFKDRVSPHFGASPKILVGYVKTGQLLDKTILELKSMSPMKIARLLVDLGVEMLICGGIQSFYKEWLISKGISVLDNQRGLIHEIIQKLT
jgi:predicted Fe-Mo cluster-binding NifX family protein